MGWLGRPNREYIVPDFPVETVNYTLNIQILWEKYEDIAMHFNDLLMRLRTQALAGIAAISTLVGIFTKAGTPEFQSDWLIAMYIFVAVSTFYITTVC